MLGLTLREPYGVVGGIIPWNAPGPNFVMDVGPAIAAGNTIVIKPAEDAPLTPLALARLALEAGIPPGVVNVVTGYGAEAGAAIPAHPGISRMSFTGSPATGSAVMAACARNLTPLHLELGGKSPQVLLDDADIDAAIPQLARGITLNTGQVCAAGSRVVVDRSIHAEVVRGWPRPSPPVRVGPGTEDVDMGPLISAKQHDRVLTYLRWAARRAPSWSPAAASRPERSTSAGSTSSRRSSTGSNPGCGSRRRRSSGRCCRCFRSTARTRPSRWPTAPSTVWSPRSGPATSGGRSGWRVACRPDRSR